MANQSEQPPLSTTRRPDCAPGPPLGPRLFAEFIGTFFLVFTVCTTTNQKHGAGTLAPLAIGASTARHTPPRLAALGRSSSWSSCSRSRSHMSLSMSRRPRRPRETPTSVSQSVSPSPPVPLPSEGLGDRFHLPQAISHISPAAPLTRGSPGRERPRNLQLEPLLDSRGRQPGRRYHCRTGVLVFAAGRARIRSNCGEDYLMRLALFPLGGVGSLALGV
jgi:Major intrinsic protein